MLLRMVISELRYSEHRFKQGELEQNPLILLTRSVKYVILDYCPSYSCDSVDG